MKTVQQSVTNWWLILLAGILLIGFGVWVIASPVVSYISISKVLAFCILATGIFEIIFALVNFKSIESWGWVLVSGLIDFSIGGYLFLYPLITMVILPIIVGLWLLFRGALSIANAIDLRAYGFNEWGWVLFAGILIVILAFVILTNPIFGVINIIIWTACAFIWAGVFRIILALKLRKLKI